jgi:hypothetical protein
MKQKRRPTLANPWSAHAIASQAVSDQIRAARDKALPSWTALWKGASAGHLQRQGRETLAP